MPVRIQFRSMVRGCVAIAQALPTIVEPLSGVHLRTLGAESVDYVVRSVCRGPAPRSGNPARVEPNWS
jgi:hypothetical protein